MSYIKGKSRVVQPRKVAVWHHGSAQLTFVLRNKGKLDFSLYVASEISKVCLAISRHCNWDIFAGHNMNKKRKYTSKQSQIDVQLRGLSVSS